MHLGDIRDRPEPEGEREEQHDALLPGIHGRQLFRGNRIGQPLDIGSKYRIANRPGHQCRHQHQGQVPGHELEEAHFVAGDFLQLIHHDRVAAAAEQRAEAAGRSRQRNEDHEKLAQVVALLGGDAHRGEHRQEAEQQDDGNRRVVEEGGQVGRTDRQYQAEFLDVGAGRLDDHVQHALGDTRFVEYHAEHHDHQHEHHRRAGIGFPGARGRLDVEQDESAASEHRRDADRDRLGHPEDDHGDQQGKIVLRARRETLGRWHGRDDEARGNGDQNADDDGFCGFFVARDGFVRLCVRALCRHFSRHVRHVFSPDPVLSRNH